MPTTLADLENRLRIGLSLTPQEAHELLFRVVPTLQVAAVSEAAPGAEVANDAIGNVRTTAVAGQFDHGQILNPANSGILVFVKQIAVTTTATVDVQVSRFDTPLTTLLTAKSWADFRRAGNPVAEMRTQTNAAQLGVQLYVMKVAASEFQNWDVPGEIVLDQGQGLLVRNALFNLEQQVSYWWREEKR